MNIGRAVTSQGAATLFAASTSFFLFVFLARQMGADRFGRFSYILTVASVYAVIQDGGFRDLCLREHASRTRDLGMSVREIVPASLGYLIASTLFGVAAALVLPLEYKAGLVFAAVCMAFRCAADLVSSILKGRGLFEREAAWKVRVKAFSILPIFPAVLLADASSEAVFFAWTAGIAVCLFQKEARLSLSKPRFSKKTAVLLRPCLSFVVIHLCTLLYFKVDVVLLKHLGTGLDLVGNYSAAYQIVEGLVIFSTPVVHIAFVRLRANWRAKEKFSMELKKIMAIAVVSALFISISGTMLGARVISAVYGPGYALAGELFPVFMVSAVFMLPNFILTQTMVALNLEKFYACVAFATAVFNIGLNMVVIPEYSAFGAAWATVATECHLTCLSVFVIFSRRKHEP